MDSSITNFSSLPQLPKEVWVHEIFSKLGPEDLASCMKVCKLWREYASDDSLWKKLFREKFAQEPPPSVKIHKSWNDFHLPQSFIFKETVDDDSATDDILVCKKGVYIFDGKSIYERIGQTKKKIATFPDDSKDYDIKIVKEETHIYVRKDTKIFLVNLIDYTVESHDIPPNLIVSRDNSDIFEVKDRAVFSNPVDYPNDIYMYDIDKKSCTQFKHSDEVVSFTVGDTFLYSCISGCSKIFIWNLKTKRCEGNIPTEKPPLILKINENRLFYSQQREESHFEILVFDLKKNKLSSSIKLRSSIKLQLEECYDFCVNRKRLYTVGTYVQRLGEPATRIRMWDLESGKCLDNVTEPFLWFKNKLFSSHPNQLFYLTQNGHHSTTWTLIPERKKRFYFF